MKVTVEHLPQREVVLSIEAEPEEVDSYRRLAYQHLVQRARVPGFRPGKAPLAMVERFTGKAAFLEETVRHLVPEVTTKAIDAQGIEAAGQPEIEVTDFEPIKWKATVALVPKVDLGNYRDLRIDPPPIEVPQEKVEEALEEVRFAQAPWEPVERPAMMGDLVTIDVTGDEGGRAVVNEHGVQYRLDAESAAPVPGFAEQVVGLLNGDGKEFTIAFPPEHELKQYAGKAYRFDVRVSEIKTKNLPVLDDEFAKGVGDGFDSLEALRRDVEAQLRATAEREAKEALQEQAIEALVRSAFVECSPALARHEAEHMLEDREETLSRNRIGMQEYLRTVGKTREELLQEAMPVAEQRVVRSLVLTELQEKEAVRVSPEEVEEELRGLVQSASGEEDRLRRVFDTEAGRASIERTLLTRKTLERLAEIVTKTQAEAPASEGATKEKEGNP